MRPSQAKRALSDSFGFVRIRIRTAFFGTPQAKRKLSDSRIHVRIPFGLESERFFEGLLKQNADFGFVHRLGFIIFNEPDPTTRSGGRGGGNAWNLVLGPMPLTVKDLLTVTQELQHLMGSDFRETFGTAQ